MVSLEHRNLYTSSIQQDEKLLSFYNFLEGLKTVVNHNELNNQTDIDFISLIEALLDDNEESVLKLYNNFARKNPTSTSPWLNNDLLILILIVGITRYNINRTWIIKVINTRITQDSIQAKINETFRNILSDNLASTSNLFEIIIIFKYIEKITILNNDIELSYNSIINRIDLFEIKNDFLICVSLKALDVIILTKGLIDQEQIRMYESFSKLFSQRADKIGNIIKYILSVSLIVGVILFYIKDENTFNIIAGILGFLGLGILSFFNKTKIAIASFIRYIFGYNKIFNHK